MKPGPELQRLFRHPQQELDVVGSPELAQQNLDIGASEDGTILRDVLFLVLFFAGGGGQVVRKGLFLVALLCLSFGGGWGQG